MIPKFTLANGQTLPAVALGTYQAKDGNEAYSSVIDALSVGYRSFDTAMFYFNEVSIGKAVRECGLSRGEVQVTTKVWNDSHGYDRTLRAFEASLSRLGLDYVDEYLIHWPLADEEYLGTWKAMELLYKEGLIKIIGVSNFMIPTLQNLMRNCEVKPMVNQIEFNFQFQPNAVTSFCKANDILVEAWRPLLRGELEREPVPEMAKKYGKTSAQIALRWLYQRGVRTLPKSTNKARMAENIDIFDFELEECDVLALNALNKSVRTGESPDEFVFMGEVLIGKMRGRGYPV